MPASLSRPARGRRVGATASAAAAAFIALGALSPGVAHASPLTPPPQFWSPDGNESVLLNAADVAAITRTRGLRVTDVSSRFADGSARVEPPACVVALQPADRFAYPDAINVTTVVIDDGARGRETTRIVQQSVVDFTDASAARARFDSASAAWARCGGQPVTMKTRSGSVASWSMGAPAPRHGGAVLTAVNLGPGLNCERAMSLREGLVVDVRVCALGDGGSAGQAEVIAAAVGDKATQRRR